MVFKSDNTNSNSYISQCYCAIYVPKVSIIIEKLDEVIVNIPEPFLNQTNAS